MSTPFQQLQDARAKMDAAMTAAQGDATSIETADGVVAEREAALESARTAAAGARTQKQANRDAVIEACDATDAATAAIRTMYSN